MIAGAIVFLLILWVGVILPWYWIKKEEADARKARDERYDRAVRASQVRL